MQSHISTRSTLRRLSALAGAGVIVTAVSALDLARRGHAPLEKYAPDWTAFGWLKMAASLAAALLVFVALRGLGAGEAVKESPGEARLAKLGAAVTLSILALTTLAVILSPTSLEPLIRENSLISVLTDVPLAAAAALLLSAAWRSRGSGWRVLGLPQALILAGMALVTFLVLMEEMSWGQHLFHWTTGHAFDANLQHETNLHNFSTYKFEAAYYVAAFLAFVALPLLWPRGGRWSGLEAFVPSRTFALAGLPLASLFYQEWNVVPYQVTAFLGLILGAGLVLGLTRDGLLPKAAGPAILALLVVSQVVFLSQGHRLTLGYELSEVRELIIACLIAMFAVVMLRRAGASATSEARLRASAFRPEGMS